MDTRERIEEAMSQPAQPVKPVGVAPLTEIRSTERDPVVVQFPRGVFPKTEPLIPVTRTSEQTDKLWPAYLEALKAIDPVVKPDSEMSVTRDGSRVHHYASRAKILSHIWKPLVEAGLVLTQAPARDGDDKITVETRITHAASGQWVSCSLGAALADNTPHKVGTAVTYCQRYTLCGLIPLAADEDHDDPPESAPNPFGNPDDVEKANLESEKKLGKCLGRVDGKYFVEARGGGSKKEAAHKKHAPHPKAVIHKSPVPLSTTGKLGYYWFLPPEYVTEKERGIIAPTGPQLSPEDQADADALFSPATPEQQAQDSKRKGKKGKGGWSLTNAGYETLDKLLVMWEERHPGIKDAAERERGVQAWLLGHGYSNEHLNDPAKAEEIIDKARKAK